MNVIKFDTLYQLIKNPHKCIFKIIVVKFNVFNYEKYIIELCLKIFNFFGEKIFTSLMYSKSGLEAQVLFHTTILG